MEQLLSPVSDTSVWPAGNVWVTNAGLYTPSLYTGLNDYYGYVKSPQYPTYGGGAYKFKIANGITPSSGNHIFIFYAKNVNMAGSLPWFSFYQGATPIIAYKDLYFNSSYQKYGILLSAYEVSLITDYTDLYFEFGISYYDTPSAGAHVEIGEFYFEIPEALSPSSSSSSMVDISSSSSYFVEWSSSSSSKSSLSSQSLSSSTSSWSSESSNSSSSSSISSSSSSSSRDFISRNINFSVINQNNGDILPFVWVKEAGVQGDVGGNSILGFTIESSNSAYFDYSAVISRDNSYLTSSGNAPSVYVPNADSSQYKHENEFYVDIIGKDSSGIKEIRTHVEPNKYEFEDANSAGQTYFAPVFLWRR